MKRTTFSAWFLAMLLALGTAERAWAQSLTEREAIALFQRADKHQEAGEYPEAERLYRQVLAEAPRLWGEDSTNHATVLSNLAELYHVMGRYEKAEPLYQRSLEIRQAKLGKAHPDVAASLHNLALLYQVMGRYEQAEPLYRRSLEIQEAKLGKDHPDVAASLNNLANLYEDMGRYEQAEPLYRRSLEIYEAKLGKDHPLVAASLNNLANLYSYMGRYEQAEPLYRRSLEIYEAKLGKDHPDVAKSLNNLAILYAAQDKPEPAADHYDRMRRIVRRHAGRILPLLSEREQLDFFHRKDEGRLHAALTLGYRRAGDAELASRSAAWLLNAKGLAQQTRAQTALAARDTNDPRSGEAFQQLLDVRRQLARLILNPPTATQENAYRQRQQQLSEREQELVKQLQRQGASVEDVDPWIELPKLRAALPDNTVFLDIARFDVCDFKATGMQKHWQPARYVAWLTLKQGPVCVIDLGEADKIDTAVQKARKALDEAPKHLKADGEIDAEKAARQALNELSALVLKPLRPHIDGAERWVICPDGNLWLAPWAALSLDDKSYVVEKHTIQLVTSGRDLVPSPYRRQQQTTAATLFADPDFNHAIGSALLASLSCSGSIGDWRVIFTFAEEGKLQIYDAEDRSLAGQGDWSLSGNELTMKTRIARFTGWLADGRFSGERELRGDDGQVTRDRWQFRLPEGTVREPVQTRGLAELKLGRVPRLPGTAAEAEAVAEQMQQLFQDKPQLFAEDKATTSAFLALKRPRALVLATHGFFLPDQEISAEERERLARDPNAKLRQRIEDPLLRSGLLLAGCNKASSSDTGVLTAKEVLSADLRGCEMVVLSACETGLGDVHIGEGVAGLRQAFQLAGAQSVLASLWKVPDDETALLMVTIMSGLGKGQDRAEALAGAQRKRIAARRDKFGAAHPYFWAAFSLTGDDSKNR